jgi:S-adenosylmethionine:tRNA ribosyltransferase-isomerase
MLKLSDFDYSLPKELIAQYPLEQRDNSRLMVLNRKRHTIEHCTFRDILDYLKPDDILVLNDTKVLPSRIKGMRKTGAKVDVLLLNHKVGAIFEALIKPSRVKLNEELIFNNGSIKGRITGKNEITFSIKSLDEIYKIGEMPLPPYIKREPQALDRQCYQTVYAKNDGAVASPTAGLHFTQELIDEIKSHHINIAYITLHVGYATFNPVKSEDITQHQMYYEHFNIPQQTIGLLEKERVKARIFAVGTTSCRALETLALGKNEGETNLFIYPGYKFKIVDCLLTNFHLPRTTLFILVCAFAGEKFIKKAYQEAIDKKYRFYSYGDAMLII